MARQILPLAGQIIGGMVGGPVGAAIGGAIGGLVGNAIDPQIIKGPKLGDGQVQTSAEGVFRPIVLGTGAVMGNIIHRGPEVVRTHRESQGKGGGPKVESERRYRTFAIRIAEGPIAGVLRIWMDEKLVYDIRPDSEIPAESEQFAEGFQLYLGGEDQLPDPDLEAYLGVGNVNAYRGTAYIVFANFDLTDYGDRIPQFRFEVVGITEGEPEVGEIVAERWFSPVQAGRTFYSFINENGQLSYMKSDGRLYPGDTYSRGVLGINLNDEQAPTTVTWTESDPLGLPFTPLAIDPMGRLIISDGYGKCLLGAGGSVIGNFRPTDADDVFWWYGEELYSPQYGGLIWFKDGFFYLGVRATGSSASGASYTNRLLKFPIVPGEDVANVDIATNVGSTSHPRFWMHMAGDGLIYILGADSIFSVYDHSLNLVYSKPYTADISLVGGIGTDGNVLVVYKPSRLEFRKFDDFSLIKTIALPFGGNVGHNVRIMFSGGSIYLQRGESNLGGRIYLARIQYSGQPQSVRLSDVIRFLSERCGQGEDDFDVSALSDEVDGIVFAGEYTAADCIRTLMPVYMFDASEHDAGSGYRINYVKRGGPVAATLTISDLVDEPEESVREDSLERPKKLHLHFQSPTVGYAPAKATSLRTSPDAQVTGEVSFSVPVVFSDEDEAWQRAGVMHQVAWSEVAGTQDLVLPDSWLELVPTDNIGLVLRDQQRRLRITKIENVSGTLKCEMIADRQSSYTSNLTGVPLPKPTPPPPSIVGPSVFAFLDIPALTDNNDRLLYYMAVSGQSPAWHGAVIQRSVDGGANYTDVMTVRQNTIMGELVDPVSDASEHYTDTTNVVRVQLYTDDEIQSLTHQQFLSEGGAFALENPDGTWEVMQYRDAEEDSNGDWLLTTLLRGRLNTETSAHVAGARFVLLDGVYAIDAETSMIGQDLTHRVVSLGTSPETAPTSTDTYTAHSQTEWPVAHILSDGVQGGSLPVRVVPRHRFGTEDHPVRSVNWQGYRITASDGANSATAETLSETHTFDVSGWSAPITVSIAQVNRFTGAGPTVSEDFT